MQKCTGVIVESRDVIARMSAYQDDVCIHFVIDVPQHGGWLTWIADALSRQDDRFSFIYYQAKN